ncbi:MAG: DUF1698 domain-containing protein [Planctomycetota bacterium]
MTAATHTTTPGDATNANTPPPPGTTIDLPCAHRDTPVEIAGVPSPAALCDLSPESSDAEVNTGIDWIASRIGWYHSVDLRPGLTTPGGRAWEHRSRVFDYASLVRGKSVLDVGAMEGGDTFAAEDAGASRVVAADVDHYLQYDLGLNDAWDEQVDRLHTARASGPDALWAFSNAKRAGFDLCARVRGTAAERVTSSVYDLDPTTHGTFDVTFCFGLLYHLRHPLLALDRLFALTGETMLISCQIDPEPKGDAAALSYYAGPWRGSRTNWFVPTYTTLIGWLSDVGFARMTIVDSSKTAMMLRCDR